MKLRSYRQLYIHCLLLLGAWLISSCTDDLLYDKDMAESGIVEVSVGLSIPEIGEKELLSRSDDGKLQLQVYDLMVFAFSSDGTLAQRYFFQNLEDGVNECDSDWSSDSSARLNADPVSGKISLLNMRVPAGKGYLMAVANIEIKSTTLLNKLKAIENREQLLALHASDSHYDSDASIMSGAYMESADASVDSFDPSGSVLFRSGTLSGIIHLLSTTASVKFNINGKGSGSKGGIFTLESYEIVNLPYSTPLISQIGTISGEDTAKTVNTGEIEVFEEDSKDHYTFDFQVLEYLNAGSGITDYKRRADWDYTLSQGKPYKVFTHAPSDAPYVILRGKYNGKSDYVDENKNSQSGNVTAEVTYYIFLGHNSDKDPNDFSTRRNFNYTYNITINGIKDITVEVNNKDNTVRQDVEGDVIVMESSANHRFDAHYCQIDFSMTVKEIRELYDKGLLGFRAVVPAYGVDEVMMLKKNPEYKGGRKDKYINENSKGWAVYDSDGKKIEGSTDYYKKKGYMDLNNLACVSADWLRFYQHRGTDLDKKTWQINYTDKLKTCNSNNNPWMLSIYRFLWQLVSLAESARDDGEVIYFTVFVQENYYGNNWNDRMVMSHGKSGTSGKVHWSQFVNTDDRKVLLFPQTEVSTDGASKFSNPRRVFSQCSIRTVYKPSTDYKAWGVETIEEFIQPSASQSWFTGTDWTSARKMIRIAEVKDNKRAPFNDVLKNSISYTSDDYARIASFDNLKGKDWKYFLDFDKKHINNNKQYRISGNLRLDKRGTIEENVDMIAACLGRNRDLNGDGKINPAEIRWYVPGIRQLQALYVGNSGLPIETRLYQQEVNERKWVYKHYMSATRRYNEETKKYDTTNEVLWAEEGPSTGQAHASYAYGLHVRCVRDLGTDLTKSHEKWGDSFELHPVKAGNSAGYIDINRFNDNCIRYALENKDLSGIVTTFSNANRPARSFYYAKEIINVGPTKTFTYSDGSSITVPDWTSGLVQISDENKKSESNPQKKSLCAQRYGQGWRTPTITEVAIMYWGGVFGRDKNVMSRTRYTFWNDPIIYGTDIITGKFNDKGGRDPHSFSEREFRLRYPWKNVLVPTASTKNNYTQITGHYGGILCVKDKF
ncbi:MAG: hypothetical protein K2K64_04775 [Muribaculaceae bacterium]|nr:hypothetical protein [Muribaculaceae bacterium]